MTVHVLKAWPEPFADVRSGAKKAEVRVNDRGYRVSDLLVLQEFLPDIGDYTGEEEVVRVTHVQTGFGLPDGLVVMSFSRV